MMVLGRSVPHVPTPAEACDSEEAKGGWLSKIRVAYQWAIKVGQIVLPPIRRLRVSQRGSGLKKKFRILEQALGSYQDRLSYSKVSDPDSASFPILNCTSMCHPRQQFIVRLAILYLTDLYTQRVKTFNTDCRYTKMIQEDLDSVNKVLKEGEFDGKYKEFLQNLKKKLEAEELNYQEQCNEEFQKIKAGHQRIYAW
jgi:hypothetical protein